ncbi:MAG: 2-C-methyl-D-erythritol 2,4-cyclodiphosphate synthase, partial [Clostridia bacterium]|nr:2-C-methyl-D-erythritol 2,4-cyclodiphosphate synthase [Clostridia bacterium]
IVIMCAAGNGDRAGFNKNNLLAPLFGAPVLYHPVRPVSKLAQALKERGDELFETVVACSPRDMAEITAICSPFKAEIREGGATRTDSVYNALKRVSGDIVLIQDGARPFTSLQQYLECVACVKEHKSAVVAMPSTDTVYIADGNRTAHIPERSNVFAVQTPQGFFTKDIKAAYEKAITSGETFTDDGSVYSRYISPVRICPCGSAENKKLTFKEDFDNLNAIIPRTVGQSGGRCGFGVDVHAFGKKQNFVTLCGVKVPCDTGLVAHSDGDAAIHAIIDAVLSAAGLRDIGSYFPDTDPKYKNADSGELLKKAVALANEQGFEVAGVSVSVQAEKPRLSPYIEQMRSRISELTETDVKNIAVAAGTCEGLGFVGEKRGVCAYCVATLKTKEKDNG